MTNKYFIHIFIEAQDQESLTPYIQPNWKLCYVRSVCLSVPLWVSLSPLSPPLIQSLSFSLYACMIYNSSPTTNTVLL